MCHELVVRVTGTRVTGTVNDSVTVEHTLDKPLTGHVGVWAKRDAVTLFRNFQVNKRFARRPRGARSWYR